MSAADASCLMPLPVSRERESASARTPSFPRWWSRLRSSCMILSADIDAAESNPSFRPVPCGADLRETSLFGPFTPRTSLICLRAALLRSRFRAEVAPSLVSSPRYLRSLVIRGCCFIGRYLYCASVTLRFLLAVIPPADQLIQHGVERRLFL